MDSYSEVKEAGDSKKFLDVKKLLENVRKLDHIDKGLVEKALVLLEGSGQRFLPANDKFTESWASEIGNVFDELNASFLEGLEVEKSEDLMVRFCHIVEDFVENACVKSCCGSIFVGRMIRTALNFPGSLRLQRASLESLCSLVTKSPQNQRLMNSFSKECNLIFKEKLPSSPDFLVQATLSEILYRTTRKEKFLLEEYLSDSSLRNRMFEIQCKQKPNLIKEIRFFVNCMNESQGSSRVLESFHLLSVIYNGKAACLSEDDWIDFSTEPSDNKFLQHFTFFCGFNFKNNGSITECTSELVDICYKDIKEFKRSSECELEVIVKQPNGSTQSDESSIILRFSTDDMDIIEKRIFPHILKEAQQLKNAKDFIHRKVSIGILSTECSDQKSFKHRNWPEDSRISDLDARPLVLSSLKEKDHGNKQEAAANSLHIFKHKDNAAEDSKAHLVTPSILDDDQQTTMQRSNSAGVVGAVEFQKAALSEKAAGEKDTRNVGRFSNLASTYFAEERQHKSCNKVETFLRSSDSPYAEEGKLVGFLKKGTRDDNFSAKNKSLKKRAKGGQQMSTTEGETVRGDLSKKKTKGNMMSTMEGETDRGDLTKKKTTGNSKTRKPNGKLPPKGMRLISGKTKYQLRSPRSKSCFKLKQNQEENSVHEKLSEIGKEGGNIRQIGIGAGTLHEIANDEEMGRKISPKKPTLLEHFLAEEIQARVVVNIDKNLEDSQNSLDFKSQTPELGDRFTAPPSQKQRLDTPDTGNLDESPLQPFHHNLVSKRVHLGRDSAFQRIEGVDFNPVEATDIGVETLVQLVKKIASKTMARVAKKEEEIIGSASKLLDDGKTSLEESISLQCNKAALQVKRKFDVLIHAAKDQSRQIEKTYSKLKKDLEEQLVQYDQILEAVSSTKAEVADIIDISNDNIQEKIRGATEASEKVIATAESKLSMLQRRVKAIRGEIRDAMAEAIGAALGNLG